MNLDTVRQLRTLLADAEWFARTRAFAAALGSAGHDPGGLFIVGTPDHEPWHLVAHLGDVARQTSHPELAPSLIRHYVPSGAPPHLAIRLSRLEKLSRRESVLVIAPEKSPPELLNRLEDAHRCGATIFAIETGDLELQGLAHETLTVEDHRASKSPADGATTRNGFDSTQHLLGLVALDQHRGFARHL
jgi:hypothetical protein